MMAAKFPPELSPATAIRSRDTAESASVIYCPLKRNPAIPPARHGKRHLGGQSIIGRDDQALSPGCERAAYAIGRFRRPDDEATAMYVERHWEGTVGLHARVAEPASLLGQGLQPLAQHAVVRPGGHVADARPIHAQGPARPPLALLVGRPQIGCSFPMRGGRHHFSSRSLSATLSSIASAIGP
jgi:hypothetical protein